MSGSESGRVAELYGELRLGIRDRAPKAASALGAMGPAGIRALLSLIADDIASSNGWEAAADALVSVGAPAVPALVNALRSTEYYRVRGYFSDVLARIGTPAVPSLVGALNAASSYIEQDVILDVLTRIGGPAMARAAKEGRLSQAASASADTSSAAPDGDCAAQVSRMPEGTPTVIVMSPPLGPLGKDRLGEIAEGVKQRIIGRHAQVIARVSTTISVGDGTIMVTFGLESCATAENMRQIAEYGQSLF